MPEFFRNGKDTVPVSAVDKLTCHSSGAFASVKITACWTESGMTSKRNKLQVAAMRAGIHGTAVSWVTAVDHLVNIFNFNRTRVESIKYLFVMIAENILEYVHRIIMSN